MTYTEMVTPDSAPIPADESTSNRILGELVLAARDGDAAAGEQLFVAIKPYATAIARRTHPTDPEASVQDAFLKVWEKGVNNPDFEPINVRGWLARILHNQANDAYRRGAKVYFSSLDVALEGEARSNQQEVATAIQRNQPASTEQIVIEEIMSGEMIAALLDHPKLKVHAAAFRLHLDGYSYKEIADALDMEMGTVRSQLSRAKAILRTMVEDGSVVLDHTLATVS